MFSMIELIALGAKALVPAIGTIVGQWAGKETAGQVESGLKFLADAGPTAVQLIEDLRAGNLTAEQVQARWDEARATYLEGRAAWDAAAPKEPPAA